jgi:hypothetical protein
MVDQYSIIILIIIRNVDPSFLQIAGKQIVFASSRRSPLLVSQLIPESGRMKQIGQAV